MPDISMCSNEGCEAKTRCHRHAASGTMPSDPWQTYSTWGDCEATADCPGFWPKLENDQPPKGSSNDQK